MQFEDIGAKCTVVPGEYLLHNPTQQIVLCGAFKPQEGKIKALANGRLIEDNIENFRKIKLDRKERISRVKGGCGGCKK
jgi:hypothetical protein|tara:strand:- start:21 stop:257 length:237 start_codon:yes stop_codon:yes gene_type:complete